ncbi:hypothetical protein Hamer_G030234, partial [Homarus americanus]
STKLGSVVNSQHGCSCLVVSRCSKFVGVTAGAPQLPHDPEAEHAPTTQPPVTIIMDAEDPSNHRNNKMDSAASTWPTGVCGGDEFVANLPPQLGKVNMIQP